jgi:SLOG family YspA-like protein
VAVIAIIGSRSIKTGDDLLIAAALEPYRKGDVLISGGARGVDHHAERLAGERGLTVVSLRPQKVRGSFFVEKFINVKTAGLVGDPPVRFATYAQACFDRNWMIAREAKDGVTAIWDGASTGTAHGIACACYLDRKLQIYLVEVLPS